jgi:quercetin dioxygenase-like cupin family protein
MKRTTTLILAVIVSAAMSLMAQQKPKGASSSHHKAASKREAIVKTPDQLDWQPAKRLPAGAQVAVLDGNPMKADHYVMRLKLPDGFKIPPHWHPADEHVTVLQGEIKVGMGSTWDDSKLNTAPTGTYANIPAHQQHFGQAQGETILQLGGTGPWQIHYVNPSDDPEHKK